MNTNANVDEMEDVEHRQAIDRHAIFEDGVDTEREVERANARREDGE